VKDLDANKLIRWAAEHSFSIHISFWEAAHEYEIRVTSAAPAEEYYEKRAHTAEQFIKNWEEKTGLK
jgi:hypothetical protein